MGEHTPEHDPRSRFEDEGIPDLQDGTPEQQWAVDPQEAPLPGDEPIAVDDYGTTVDEQIQGEPLDGRLEREVPEDQPVFGADEPRGRDGGGDAGTDRVTDESGLGVGSDLDTDREADSGVEEGWPAQPEEPSGQVWDDPRRAGRLVAPDEGAHGDIESDEVAREVGPDSGGYSAEESAMRVEPE
ncbi:DUF5709 domain-containing protein [Nonomuraea sp. NPDC003214]